MRRLLFISALVLMACNGPTDPDTNPDTRRRGTLFGTVTIGPNCPAAQGPCPTPAEAYAARKVLVFDEQRMRLLFTIDIDMRGFYRVTLLPGKYVIDLQSVGMDRSTDVPKTVTIAALNEMRLDITIDTGIR